MKSGDPELKSLSDHYLDLNQVIPGSTPWLQLYTANWSASCQLGFVTCSIDLPYSVDKCIVGPHQPAGSNYQINDYYYYYFRTTFHGSSYGR